MDIFSAGFDYFTKGGPVMYPLLICSILTIVITSDRWIFFRENDCGREFTKKFCSLIELGERDEAKRVADSKKGEMAKLVTVVMERQEHFELPENFINVRAERTLDKFERHLDYLSVIVTLSPVLGLLGTITGMIASFNAFGERLDNPLAVTTGIGEALITTVYGLSISIVAMCIYAYFMRRLKLISLNLEEIGNTLLEVSGKYSSNTK